MEARKSVQYAHRASSVSPNKQQADKGQRDSNSFFRESFQSNPSSKSLNLAEHVPSDIKSAIDEKLAEEDNGAGVFGALKHVDLGTPGEGGVDFDSFFDDEEDGEESFSSRVNAEKYVASELFEHP